MKLDELKTKILLTAAVIAAVAIFFLLTLQVWDNTDAEFIYTSSDESKDEIVINSYTGNPVNLEIPKEIDGFTVVAIGDNAFSENNELKKVSIPSSVKHIGDYAFAGCDSLKTVNIENGLNSIGYRAFYKCAYLRSVELPDTLEIIDDESFRECERLKSLSIPKSCKDIGEDAFRACMSLTLDCSKNDMALEYAKDNYIATSFSQSTDYTVVKVIGLSLATLVVFVAVVTLVKKFFGKKDDVEIRFVDSELSRRDKYKDGLVADDPSKRTSARKLWLGKKRSKAQDESQEEDTSESVQEDDSNDNNVEKD